MRVHQRSKAVVGNESMRDSLAHLTVGAESESDVNVRYEYAEIRKAYAYAVLNHDMAKGM